MSLGFWEILILIIVAANLFGGNDDGIESMQNSKDSIQRECTTYKLKNDSLIRVINESVDVDDGMTF